MPIKDRKHVPLTADPRSEKRERLKAAMKDHENWEKSNRELAAYLKVDESMVRRFRNKNADTVGRLAPHTGELIPPAPKKSRRGGKEK